MKSVHSVAEGMYILRSPEEKLRMGTSEDPVIAAVDSLLYHAIKAYASDIHLEPNEQSMRVRFRLDGILHDQAPISLAQCFLVLSRFKILSTLDIAIRRLPQDGKLRVIFDDNPIDLRVSTFPSIYGEKMVIRILDRSHNCIKIEELGFNDEVLSQLTSLIMRPHGFFLVTGPTGSGKTTTLYALLARLNDSKRNIVTMEDPVEYNLDGITQSQINSKSGFTFENGLRAILRQDPDIIMIGEIRDKPTVQIAIEAALTGHLVLSTLHTNDASGALTRLIEMGVEPFLINAALSGVLAQRLVRKLCPACVQSTPPNEQEKVLLQRLGISLNTLAKSAGCRSCFKLGYRGREGVSELLIMNDELRALVMQKASSERLHEAACHSGMQTLKSDALAKVKRGTISLEEALSVI